MKRIVLQELKERPGATSEIAEVSGVSEAEVHLQLRDLNDRVKKLLGYEDDPLTATSGGAWKADGVAGLLRLNADVELEVVPKFLDPSAVTWRSDFFLLAVLVKTGHLLVHDEISASAQDRGDLATLIARSLLNSYAENQRRPIRGYRHTTGAEFAIDGDVEWDTIRLPDPDGFVVSRLHLTRENPFNATIAAAVRILVPEVADGDTQAQLQQLSMRIGAQADPPRVLTPLPQRHSAWQQTYDLAKLVVEGLGLDLKGGSFTGPGFVLSTWSAWQALCEEVVRRALPNHKVVRQMRWVLGHRGDVEVYATPDITPLKGNAAPFLLDAKYKTRLGRRTTISSADVYESLAFMRASGTSDMFLLYPSAGSVESLRLGEWRRFDKVDVGGDTIEGFELQVQGLASRGGFDRLVSGVQDQLREHVKRSVQESA